MVSLTFFDDMSKGISTSRRGRDMFLEPTKQKRKEKQENACNAAVHVVYLLPRNNQTASVCMTEPSTSFNIIFLVFAILFLVFPALFISAHLLNSERMKKIVIRVFAFFLIILAAIVVGVFALSAIADLST